MSLLDNLDDERKLDSSYLRTKAPAVAGQEWELEDRIVAESQKAIDIDVSYKFPKYKVKEVESKNIPYRCTMCGESYDKQAGNFVTSPGSRLWRANGGYIPICKKCILYLFNSYVDFYKGNEEHAIKRLCQIFDWYYSTDASLMSYKAARSNSPRIYIYPSKIAVASVAVKGTSYMDSVRDDFFAGAKINTVEDVEAHAQSVSKIDDEDAFVVTKSMLKTWGPGYSPEQYEFLEDEYADWVANHECKTKAQKELFHNLCLAQLNIRIAQRDGNQKQAADAMKIFQDLLGSSNLKPTQTADNAMSSTQTFGTLIKKIEDERPISKPDPEWEDVDGIRKYINVWFRGGLSKALHIRNENARLYEEATTELEKYTVHPPKIESDSADTSIFDNIADEGGDSK